MSAARRKAAGWLPWIAMAVVVIVALIIGTVGAKAPTAAERAHNLEESIRCPSCSSQSVANSETPAAKGVKVLIAKRIAAGDSDEQIRDYVASRYDRNILLDPSGKGFSALVWGVPVAVGILAVAALIFRFRDWRPGAVPVTDEDRKLVDDALHPRDDDAEPDPEDPA
jgi:cytochrome c-type biogenesis protein CcmH